MLTDKSKIQRTRRSEVVEVPEWGTEPDGSPLKVTVYAVSVQCRDDFAVAGRKARDAGESEAFPVEGRRPGRVQCTLLAGGLLTPDSKPMFTIDELVLEDPVVVDRLFLACARVTGLSKDGVKEAKGES